jgi:spoIIIJ-associated protein
MDVSYLETGKVVLNELLESLGFTGAEISQDQLDDQPMLAVSVHEHSLLIGRRGENLYALQTLFNSLVRRRDTSAPLIALDVAGYKKDHLEKIMRIAEDAAQKVQVYGHDFELKPMTPYERRIVHMVLADKADLETDSIGEDPHRKVIIKKKSD